MGAFNVVGVMKWSCCRLSMVSPFFVLSGCYLILLVTGAFGVVYSIRCSVLDICICHGLPFRLCLGWKFRIGSNLVFGKPKKIEFGFEPIPPLS